MKFSRYLVALRPYPFHALINYYICITFIFSLTAGCTDKAEVLQAEVLIDLTSADCNTVGTDAIKLIASKMGADEDLGAVRTGCKTTVTPFNGQLYRPGYLASVDTAPGYLTRNHKERTYEIVRFFNSDLISAVNSACSDEGDTSRTFLYHGLINSLKTLTESDADKRVCILFSDIIENGDISFYDFRENPEQLMIKHDSLRKLINKRYGRLPYLTDIEVVMIHTPEHKDQNLFDYSLKFLKKFIADRDGRFTFKKKEGE